ncbi:6-hydroxy-D-nicotine oxidase [Cyphellophora attinorum]|uniref:6-hydroxy-D-nicotine oxidase n=1 Tax=Cyphellophora attinorum TaxID=1664694 RepID=A0A0N1H6A2_9EURO|nr:6-hydroxy-D-nicotine oxidase [Phialophora attinorum]KPI41513.1 6-hydroxy-D-nicotine oxidase [Phialophora attinorum]
MGAMNSIEVFTAEEQSYAIVGGGARIGDLNPALAAAGYRTTTGVCECVGLAGLALGGGHGRLQGQYGLVADQTLSTRLVLANGSIVTASATSHPDLFWALRGAGHYFGIVTEFKLKIYPAAGHESWAISINTFPGSRLEEVCSTVNTIVEHQPAEAVHMSMISLNPAISTTDPIITYIAFYDSPASALAAHIEPLIALQPLSTTSEVVPYTALSKFLLSSADAVACWPNAASLLRFPVDFHTPYNISAMRQVYDLMARTFRETPALNQTWLAIEGYSDQAVRSVPDEETSFPWRGDNLLISPFVIYGAGERGLDGKAREFVEGIRKILNAGAGRKPEELHAYVNYGNGREKGGMGRLGSGKEVFVVFAY